MTAQDRARLDDVAERAEAHWTRLQADRQARQEAEAQELRQATELLEWLTKAAS